MYVHHSIGGIDHLETGIDHLISHIDEIVARNPAWDLVQQTRGGIAAWEVGIDQILRSVSHPLYFYNSNNQKNSATKKLIISPPTKICLQMSWPVLVFLPEMATKTVKVLEINEQINDESLKCISTTNAPLVSVLVYDS